MTTSTPCPSPPPSVRWFVLVLFLVLLTAGCGGVREVQTQPPRPAVTVPDTTTATDRMPLAVTFGIEASMPEDVTALRLRVAALWMKPVAGAWEKRAVPSGVVESAGPPARLLAAGTARQRLDSLAVVLTDPFVTFGPNAGGPLTVADSGVVRVGLDLRDGEAATLRLRLDPAASLARDSTGARWTFRPALTVSSEPATDRRGPNAPRPRSP